MMEPMALFFNWVIAAQCLTHAFQLKKLEQQTTFNSNWYFFFLCFGVSTFFGGLSHFFYHYTGMLGKVPGWSLAILAITFLELAVVPSISSSVLYKRIIWLFTIIVLLVTVIRLEFVWVTIHTALGLVVVLTLSSIKQIRLSSTQWWGYIFGVFFMLLSLPFMIGKIDLHVWFNRHDISHLLMIGTLYWFYITTRRIVVLN